MGRGGARGKRGRGASMTKREQAEKAWAAAADDWVEMSKMMEIGLMTEDEAEFFKDLAEALRESAQVWAEAANGLMTAGTAEAWTEAAKGWTVAALLGQMWIVVIKQRAGIGGADDKDGAGQA